MARKISQPQFHVFGWSIDEERPAGSFRYTVGFFHTLAYANKVAERLHDSGADGAGVDRIDGAPVGVALGGREVCEIPF